MGFNSAFKGLTPYAYVVGFFKGRQTRSKLRSDDKDVGVTCLVLWGPFNQEL